MSSEKTYAIKQSRTEALVTHEGIMIASSALSGEQALCGYAKRNHDGTIERIFYNQSIIAQYKDYKKEFPGEYKYVTDLTSKLEFVISGILALIAIFGGKIATIICITLWPAMYISSALHNIAHFFSVMFYHKKIPSISRYHGAEHMALAALEKHHRIPTLKEVLQENKYDNNCTSIETSFSPLIISILNTIIMTASLIPIILLILHGLCNWDDIFGRSLLLLIVILYIAGLGFAINNTPEIVNKGFKSGFLTKLTQWTVVKTPTIEDIEVAIEALKIQEFLDEIIKNDPKGFVVNVIDFDIDEKQAVYQYENGQEARITLDEYIASVKSLRDAVLFDDTNEEKKVSQDS